jgi:catechol 2,3-dioxygenase-like lactoylglutathione lyase family enzyme
MLTIAVTSVFVDDQEKALALYTDVLGFVKTRDLPLGAARWLSVVSPAAPDGVELLLEPNDNPISRTYQQAVHDVGIPVTTFATDDVHKEYRRMTELGVTFTGPPARAGEVTGAVFDDTCGNLIGLFQP